LRLVGASVPAPHQIMSTCTLKHRRIEMALQMSAIFSGLPQEDLETMAELCQLRQLNKGEVLFHEGEPYRGFYVVRTGVLKIFRSNLSGKEQVLRMVGAGESFGEAAMGDRTAFPASVQAERPSEVILVPASEFSDQMLRNPRLAMRLLASTATQLRHLVTLVDDLTLKNVEARFSLYLLRLSGRMPPVRGQEVQIPVTWQVLASHLGCTSESLSRLLKFLKNRGTIKVEGHCVTIVEPEDLISLGQMM
jgi:CRP/FNR family transcriptional regulator, dissimilatory nitrate respiration regulator